MKEIRFAHIINTVAPGENPSLDRIQELTLRTILAATKNYSGTGSVEILSASFPGNTDYLPAEIRPTRPLETCAAERKELETSKRFPLIREIIQRLDESKEATHFIFTNLDICVLPDFYNVAAKVINDGHDAIVINRRRISARFLESDDLEMMYAEAGKTHAGYDCFIFHRDLISRFILKDVFIGTPPAGGDLFHNLFTFADRPILFAEKHLTFHIGMELAKDWGDPVLNEHNEREFMKMMKELRPHMQIVKFPGAGLGFFKRHFKWLMNPTFHYPTMAWLDLKWRGPRPVEQKSEEKSAYLEWLMRQINFRDRK